ncbi:MAG: type IV pilus secretin PilQ [Desulfobacterales bacterium]|nr:type IV pilus secretin PilQ [Desulfobacterales bacterium]
MDKPDLSNKVMRNIIAVVISVLLVGSCATPKKEKQDPFFDKWKTKAETSKGISPATPKPLDEQPKVIKPKAPPKAAKIEEKKQKPLPTRTISLKMTNIEVSVVLRALARAADQNIIVSQQVAGKININIAKAPWNQVFIGILRTHGLSYAWEGEIIRIMTADDMEEDIKRQARKRELKLTEPPLTRIVPIKFSSADKLKDNLEKFLTVDKDGKPIGSILVDDHTNSLIIQAIRNDMTSIVSVIEQLDKPTPQVLIEAYIVEANKDVARELGIQWGGLVRTAKGAGVGFGTGRDNQALGGTVDTAVNPTSGTVVDLPARSLSGFEPFSLGLVYQNIGDLLLTAQLSALQDKGKLNILSSPSITTLDNQTAYIESGQDIPFQTVEDGEVNVEYKKAVLSLRVTPHVIDNKTLKMYINVHKDEADFSQTVLGNPTIITKNAETNVIQMDGQTIVIGGLNKETTARSDTGVPYLEDIPGLGYLFKRKSSADQLEDLLIFITPHILQPPSN